MLNGPLSAVQYVSARAVDDVFLLPAASSRDAAGRDGATVAAAAATKYTPFIYSPMHERQIHLESDFLASALADAVVWPAYEVCSTKAAVDSMRASIQRV